MRTLVLVSLFILSMWTADEETKACKKAVKHFKNRKLKCVDNPALGKGGFGRVFMVTDKNDKQHPLKALKVVDFGKASYETQQQMKVEAQILSQVKDHSHVIQFFEVQEDEKGLYILMEYCPAGSLSQFRENYPEEMKNPHLILTLIDGIVKGVETIQSLGFAVRDLKPANVVLTADLTPKIIDLGLAMKLGSETTSVGGTKSYIDPRIWEIKYGPLNGLFAIFKIDEWMDIFAIGASIRTLLTPNHLSTGLVKDNIDAKGKTYEAPFQIASGTELTTACLMHWCTLIKAEDRPSIKEMKEMLAATLSLPDDACYQMVGETTVSPKQKTLKDDFIRQTDLNEPTIGSWKQQFRQTQEKFQEMASKIEADMGVSLNSIPKESSFAFFSGIRNFLPSIFGGKTEKPGIRLLLQSPSSPRGSLPGPSSHCKWLLPLVAFFLALLPLAWLILHRRSVEGLSCNPKEALAQEKEPTTDRVSMDIRNEFLGPFSNQV